MVCDKSSLLERGEMLMTSSVMNVTGTEINYYFVCKKKLWFFVHDIHMEQTSQYVEIGKEIHENSFNREKKEIQIDGTIVLDFWDKDLVIHETKKSKAMEDATRYQLLYYIYYLKQKGIEGVKGIVHFPAQKRTETVELQEEDILGIEQIIGNINQIKALPVPPNGPKLKICNKCSYYELCFC